MSLGWTLPETDTPGFDDDQGPGDFARFEDLDRSEDGLIHQENRQFIRKSDEHNSVVSAKLEVQKVAEFDVSADKAQAMSLCIREDIDIFGATEADIANVVGLNARET